MRILVSGVGRDSFPTGICRVAANHVRALLDSGVASRVGLVIGSWQRDLFEILLGRDAKRVDLEEVNIRNSSSSRNLWYATALPCKARAYGAELVHYSFPAPVFRGAFRCPVVLTLHDLYPYDIPEHFGFPQYLANRLILRQCLSVVDGIGCVSGPTRSRLAQIFPKIVRRVPTVVTGNYSALSVEPATPLTPPKGFDSTTNYILTVAQHRKNKNLDVLIRAYAQAVSRRIVTGDLVIVGSEGPESGSLRALGASVGLSNRIRFLHSVHDPELKWLYANCTLFLICSSIEGYCLPLTEALDNRARTVCSDIPILRELGGNQCTYFELSETAVPNLASAMQVALTQPFLESSPTSSLRRMNVIAEYLRLYSTVSPSGAWPQLAEERLSLS